MMDNPEITQPSEEPLKDDLYLQALLLSKVVTRTLQQRGRISPSSPPELVRTGIVEFMKRMQVWSIDKFKDPCYISLVNFYYVGENGGQGDVAGAVLLYIMEDYIPYLFRRLGYPDIDIDDVEMMKDACGTFGNIVTGLFKTGMEQLGFEHLMMSHFKTYYNEVPGGVEYNRDSSEKFIVNFCLNEKKQLVAEVTMGPLRRERPA